MFTRSPTPVSDLPRWLDELLCVGLPMVTAGAVVILFRFAQHLLR